VRYVALLRGVNIGGRTLRMAELRECLEACGFRGVATVAQSGNVLFEASAAAAAARAQIERALTERFEYPARAHVVSLSRLRKIVAACPYADDDPAFHAYVVFVQGAGAAALAGAAGELDEGEALSAGAGVVYWRCRRGRSLDSPFAKLLAKAPQRERHTTRNARTLQRILAAAS